MPNSASLVEQFTRGPRFTHAVVVRLTGVPSLTLQNWAKPDRGIVVPVVASPGRQGRREYTPLQVAAIGGCLDLIECGLAPSLAFTIAQSNLHAIIAAEVESRPKNIKGDPLPVFHGPIEDYFNIARGPLREHEPLPITLVRKHELADWDFSSRSMVVMPTGKLLVEMAKRATSNAAEG